MSRRCRRVLPWFGVAVLVALVATAASVGSLASKASKRVSTLSVTPKPDTLTSPTDVLRLCQNGQIPKGAAGCRLVGIYQAAQASEIFGWAFQVTNAYSGVYAGQYLTVYAGAVLSPDPSGRTAHGIPGGGGVRVDLDQSHNVVQFLAPQTTGLVYIKAVSGGVVTLQREDGTTVTFNLATDTYS
jgi:hypothetical protein